MTPEDRDYLSELNALDDQPDSEPAPKAVSADLPPVVQGAIDGTVQRARASTERAKDLSVSKSALEEAWNEANRWSHELGYHTDLAADPSKDTLSPEIRNANIEYAKKKLAEAEAKRDAIKADLKAKTLGTTQDGPLPTWLVEPFKEFSSGLIGGTASKLYGLKQYADSAERPDIAEGIGAFAQGLDETNANIPFSGVREYNDAQSFADYAKVTGRKAVGALGFAAPLIAEGALGVEGVPFLVSDAVSTGHGMMRQALEQEGVTDPQALAKGTYLYGSIAAVTQAVLPAIVGRSLTKPAAEAFSGTIAQVVAKMAKGATVTGAENALAMGATEAAIKYGVHDVSGKPLDGKEFAHEVFAAMGEGFAVGMVGFGLPHQVIKGAKGEYRIGKPTETAQEAQPAPEAQSPTPTETSAPTPAKPEEQAVQEKQAIEAQLADLATDRSEAALQKRAELEQRLAEVEVVPEEQPGQPAEVRLDQPEGDANAQVARDVANFLDLPDEHLPAIEDAVRGVDDLISGRTEQAPLAPQHEIGKP